MKAIAVFSAGRVPSGRNGEITATRSAKSIGEFDQLTSVSGRVGAGSSGTRSMSVREKSSP
jgi:hypothetical protein